MSTTAEMIGLLAVLAVCVGFCAAMIWGRMPEKIYEARANSPRAIRWFLMSGELMKDKVRFVRFMRRLACAQLIFVVVVCALLLLWVLL
jgi:hypothetical protein